MRLRSDDRRRAGVDQRIGAFMANRTTGGCFIRPKVVAILIGLVCAMTAATADRNPNPRIFAPNSDPYDQSYADWTTAWWQWAFSLPADQNPLLDNTGAKAANGQSGDVWFLCGIFGGGGSVERTITVPPDKALLFPIYNYVWVNTPEFGDPPWSPEQEANVRGIAADAVDQLTSASAELDGQTVKQIQAYRFVTDEPFLVDFPDNNLFGIPADTYGPSVTDGYWLMVKPLSTGAHTIHFRTVSADGSVQDVTYHITVKRAR